MRMKMTKAVLALTPVALSLMIAGCTNEELVNERITKYEQNFKETFGDIDPTHDWSMATAVTANIDLSKAPAGTYEVKIYSEKNGYLLKKAIVENNAQLHFDGIKGEKYVRVLARKTSALGLTAINGYFPVEDGVVNTSKEGTRSGSEGHECNTTVGEKLDLGTTSISSATYEYKAPNGESNSTFVETIPSDGKNYITTISGEVYTDGADGKYSVTCNGSTTQMTMHEIAEILEANPSNYLMYKTETKTIYSDDQNNWKTSYASDPNVQTEYEYKAQAGDWSNGGESASLPTNDNKYYITTISGQDYSNGANGKYSVTYNGTTSQKDMYEIAEILATNNTQCYVTTTNGVKLLYYAIPAYYNVKRYYITINGYTLAGSAYVTPAYYHPTTSSVTATWAGDFYHLDNVLKTVDVETQVKFDDLLPLVSSAHPSPYFHEAQDNRSLYEDILDYDIEFVLTEDGPIFYTYVFYGSIYHNKLGYFYWHEDEGMTEAEIKQAKINAPRYVFMEDTWPETENSETGKPNLQCYNDQSGTNAHTPGGMSMPQWVDGGIEAHTGHFLQGTSYHLVYFGENYDQPATFTFPEGLHVAFFLITKYNGTNANIMGNGLFYSIQDMNEDQEIMVKEDGTKTFLNNKHWWASQVGGTWNQEEERFDVGEVAAVTYSYKGNIVMGFEDDVDKDENDMLFLISAPIVPPVSITEETEEEMSWVVACEDLGGTYDYDFNDIVFDLGQLSVYSTTTTTSEGESSSTISLDKAELFLRPLAAGGTLPAYIYFDANGDGINSDDELIGEAHDLLKAGAPTTVPINVGGMSVDPTKVARIKLADIDEPSVTEEGIKSYIAEQVAKIKIVVNNGGTKEALEVTAPDENGSNIPQMLILPRGWDWPTEHQHIFTVYPQFNEWSTDKTKNGWITDPIGSFYRNPFK